MLLQERDDLVGGQPRFQRAVDRIGRHLKRQGGTDAARLGEHDQPRQQADRKPLAIDDQRVESLRQCATDRRPQSGPLLAEASQVGANRSPEG